MAQLRLESVSRRPHADGERIDALVRDGEQHHELYIARAHGTPSDAADVWVPSLLLRAMRTGAALVVDPPVSARLAASLPRLQDIFCSFEPMLRRATVELRSVVSRPAGPARTASFFSGGVDSFYTALRSRDRLDAIIFIHGFDIPLANQPLRDQVAAVVRASAAELGVELVELETNLRSFLEDRTAPGRIGSWGMMQGGALAAAALSLATDFGHVLIPSGTAYGELYSWGTHPLIDPLWSTEGLEVEHHGCEARRLAKVETVARHPGALRILRVCFHNPGGAYNCGRCPKCVRTMLELRVHGALEQCTTFDQPLDLRLVDRQPVHVNERHHLVAIRARLQETGHDPELLAAVDRRLKRHDFGRRAAAFVTARVRELVGRAAR